MSFSNLLFLLDGFKDYKIILYISNKEIAKSIVMFPALVNKIDYLVHEHKDKNLEKIVKVINTKKLIEIASEQKVVVFIAEPEIYEVLTKKLGKFRIYNILPIKMFQYLQPFADRFDDIMQSTIVNVPYKKDSNQAILVRGKFEPIFSKILIKHLRINYPDKYIALSTWSDTPSELLEDLEIDEIILNDYPDNPSQGHRNYQIRCVTSGLKTLKDRGFQEILIQRTDQILFRKDLLTKCQRLIEEYPVENQNFKKRILVSNAFFRKHIYYHPSDMFMYGHVDDLLRFWDVPFDIRTKEEIGLGAFTELNSGKLLTQNDLVKDSIGETFPEIYLCKNMLRKIGYDIKNSQEDWDHVTREIFLIKNTTWWELFWFKKDYFFDGFNQGVIAGYPINCIDEEEWRELYLGEAEHDSNKRFEGHYVEWRNKRVNAIIDYFGTEFFRGKKILELGCGYGDIGAYFSELGAEVTCSDGREEHLNILRERHPHIKTVLYDIEKEWIFKEDFDLIIHMGVLYHIKDYEKSLREACKHTKYMVLETEVSDSTDPNFVIYTEEEGYDQALNYIGSRPSPLGIERVLDESSMEYRQIVDDRCNHSLHRYDWELQNTETWEHGLRRMWFIHQKDMIKPEDRTFLEEFYSLSTTTFEVALEIKEKMNKNRFKEALLLFDDFITALGSLANALSKFISITQREDMVASFQEVIKAYGLMEEFLRSNNREEMLRIMDTKVVCSFERYFKRLEQITFLYC